MTIFKIKPQKIPQPKLSYREANSLTIWKAAWYVFFMWMFLMGCYSTFVWLVRFK